MTISDVTLIIFLLGIFISIIGGAITLFGLVKKNGKLKRNLFIMLISLLSSLLAFVINNYRFISFTGLLFFAGITGMFWGITLLIIEIFKIDGKKNKYFAVILCSITLSLFSGVFLLRESNNQKTFSLQTSEQGLRVPLPKISLDDETFTISGTGVANSTITIRKNDEVISTLSADKNGDFKYIGNLPEKEDMELDITDDNTSRQVTIKSLLTIEIEEEQRQVALKEREEESEIQQTENQATLESDYNNEDNGSQISKAEEEAIEKQKKVLVKQIEEIVSNDLNRTEIDRITINENMGREDGSFVVLIHLIYDIKNSKSSTKETIEMFSSHVFANIVNPELVSDGAIFWQVPFYETEPNEVLAKFSFIEEDGKALIKEESFYNTLK